MSLITKATFLNYLACPTFSWFEYRKQNQELTPSDELRILEGKEVGNFAREVFSNGALVEASSNEEAAKKTAQLMSNPSITSIFEATFIYDGFIAKADVLTLDGDSWNLIEVKSSLHKEEIDPLHIDDLAYTTFVLTGAKIPLNKIEIMRISKDWRFGKSIASLFEVKDCKEEVILRAEIFKSIATDLKTSIISNEKPKPKLQKICKKCDYFSTKCIGQGVSHSILEIPRITDDKALDLYSNGIIEIKDVPDNFKLTDTQKGVVNCIKSNTPFLNRTKLAEILNSIEWPCYYLDFESILTAVPFWNDVAPYQQILTQYSLHICNNLNDDPHHEEYLAPHTSDSRRELVEHLLERLGESGSIIVYSAFEKTQLSGLAKIFPDLEDPIQKCINRLFDLEKIFKDAFIHPDFCGQTSIKKTLPALVPDLTYKNLSIGGGDSAVAAFVKMAKGFCSEGEIKELRRGLLEYCKLDTLAMVRLHRVMGGMEV